MAYLDQLQKMSNDAADEKFRKAANFAANKLLRDLYQRQFNAAIAAEHFHVVFHDEYKQQKLKELFDTTIELEQIALSQEIGSVNARNAIAYFLTINPPPNVSFDVFQDIVERLVQSRAVAVGATWTYEQRSEDPTEFHGWHVHLISPRVVNSEPYNIKKMLLSKLKKLWLPKTPTDKQFHLRWLKTELDWKRAHKYISEEKSHPGKKAKQEIDNIFRSEFELKRLYVKNAEDLQETD